ncbi:MAG: hypothetical protein RL616_2602 [Verrucomicrobiota bacterium]
MARDVKAAEDCRSPRRYARRGNLSRRWPRPFRRDTGSVSPSPWGEGRGEGGLKPKLETSRTFLDLKKVSEKEAGASGGNRTHDNLLRRQMLYPTELRTQPRQIRPMPLSAQASRPATVRPARAVFPPVSTPEASAPAADRLNPAPFRRKVAAFRRRPAIFRRRNSIFRDGKMTLRRRNFARPSRNAGFSARDFISTRRNAVTFSPPAAENRPSAARLGRFAAFSLLSEARGCQLPAGQAGSRDLWSPPVNGLNLQTANAPAATRWWLGFLR